MDEGRAKRIESLGRPEVVSVTMALEAVGENDDVEDEEEAVEEVVIDAVEILIAEGAKNKYESG